MKLSIITPVLNAVNLIDDTIESILSQKGNFIVEYWIIDGGSNDGTIERILHYKNRSVNSNVQIEFVSEKDNGLYDALIKGFKKITGDVVGYINAGDFYLPHAFSTICEVFKTNREIKWLTGLPLVFNEKGQNFFYYYPLDYKREFIRKGGYGKILKHIQQESTFWRSELLNLIDFEYLKNLKYAGDFYLWKNFAKHYDLFIVESFIAGFRIHEGQLSEDYEKYEKELYSISEDCKLIDCLRLYLERFLIDFMPDRLKKKVNQKVVKYQNGKWEIKHKKN